MELASLTRPELIFPGLDFPDGTSVLRALAERVAENSPIRDAGELYDLLAEREQVASTGVGNGVAIPHCKVQRLESVILALGLTEKGVDFGAVDGRPVRLFFVVVSPDHTPAAHLQCLAAISKWVRDGERVSALLELDDPRAIHDRLREGT